MSRACQRAGARSVGARCVEARSVGARSVGARSAGATFSASRLLGWFVVLLLGLALASLLVASCGRSKDTDPRLRPPAGLEPVTVGELVQLRLAVEGFDTVFDAKAAEQDLLPYLVHAWATFYHRPDPAASAKARYAFTEALCRARLPRLGPPWDLLSCMERLREALYDDLLLVTRAFRRTGRPDRVGEYRLSELERDFARLRKVFLQTRKDREDRRASLVLPEVGRCEPEQPTAPVVGVTRVMLAVNGFPVVTAPGGLEGITPDEVDTFASQLESRLLETPKSTDSAAQLIVAAHAQVSLPVLGRVLERAARLGVTRVCLKVERSGDFRVPCCVPIRLGPPGVWPSRTLEVGKEGVTLVDGASRVPLPEGASPSEASIAPIRLGKDARVLHLAQLCTRVWSATKVPPEVLPGAAAPKRTSP